CRSRPDARPGDFVCLKVKDNGSGISDEVRDHLFEPFFTTKPSGKGTGLGLATVYGIIKQHDGWIELSKDKTSGTTFQVFLPRTAKPSSRPKSEVRDLSRWKGDETILFVDDEQSIRLLGQTILERNGYTVIQAGDGMEAVQVFQKEHGRIGLVVLDLTMPYQSGEEVLKQIRKIEPDMRVIVSSGHTPSGDDSIVRRIHANGIIPKPYHPNELLKSVRTLLDHPTA
ncbi:MAG TPA: response regulator, partial [Nitrospiria bacterium]